MSAGEPALFWRKNAIAIVILLVTGFDESVVVKETSHKMLKICAKRENVSLLREHARKKSNLILVLECKGVYCLYRGAPLVRKFENVTVKKTFAGTAQTT